MYKAVHGWSEGDEERIEIKWYSLTMFLVIYCVCLCYIWTHFSVTPVYSFGSDIYRSCGQIVIVCVWRFSSTESAVRSLRPSFSVSLPFYSQEVPEPERAVKELQSAGHLSEWRGSRALWDHRSLALTTLRESTRVQPHASLNLNKAVSLTDTELCLSYFMRSGFCEVRLRIRLCFHRLAHDKETLLWYFLWHDMCLGL